MGKDLRELLIKAVGLHQRGSLKEAEALYRQVLSAAPRSVDALRLCGIACSQQGKAQEALTLLEKAASLSPGSADVQNALGKVLNDLGQHEKAAQACRRAAKANPAMAEAFNNLGNALFALEDHEGAEQAYREALSLQPKNAEALNNLGGVLSAVGRYEEAADVLQAAISINPGFSRALRNYGHACRNLMRMEAMLEAFEKAMEIEGRTPRNLLDCGSALVEAERHGAAIPLLREALKKKPDWPLAQMRLADALSSLNQGEESAKLMAAVLKNPPDDLSSILRIGKLLSRQGAFSQAKDWLMRAFERDPQDARAAYALSAINALSIDNPAFEQAKLTARDERQPTLNRVSAAFAAASALEKAKEDEAAFDFYRLGNELAPARPIDWERQHQRLEKLKDVFTPELFERLSPAGSADQTPVFVVGMPRSGTTLTERLLARHPDVAAAGELTAISEGLRRLGMKPDGTNYPRLIEDLDAEDIRREAEAYLETLRAIGGSQVTRVVDKLPGNAFYLGYIRLLFPKAAIVHCQRDPMDIGLSCYKANFTRLGWAFSLENIARQIDLHLGFMEVWGRILPGGVFNLPYEELVADPQTWTPRLIDAAGLPWDESCLDDEGGESGQIKTTSLWQARQPISTGSVASWKRYEKGLEPLRQGLTELGRL